MGKARTISFAVAEEGQAILDELVAYFGGGNRSKSGPRKVWIGGLASDNANGTALIEAPTITLT
jgi:hypothetical protein